MEPVRNDAPGLDALFDLSFQKFVTVGVIKIVYLLGMALIALGWLAIIIAGFAGAGFLGGIGAILIGAVVALLYLLILRMWLELIVSIFRIAQNTSVLASRVDQSTGGFPVITAAPATPSML